MQLNQQQVEQLFAFSKKKMVHWYDLQVELVDHLASRIEETMEKDPSVSFEAALQQVYKQFGIFGFSKVVQEKQNQLQRGARKMWWQEMGSFFHLPRIALLLMLGGLFYTLSGILSMNILAPLTGVLYIAAGIYLQYVIFQTSKSSKPLLLIQNGSIYISSFIFIYFFLLTYNFEGLSRLTFTLGVTGAALIEMTSFHLFFRVRKKAMQLYPDAFA